MLRLGNATAGTLIASTLLVGGPSAPVQAGDTVASQAGSPMVLMEEGEPRVRVLLQTQAPPITEFAARELIRLVEKSSGVVLPLERLGPRSSPSPSPLPGIWVGRHPQMAARGLDPDTLPPEAFWLKRQGGDLVVAGNEGTRGWEGPEVGPSLFPKTALLLHHDYFGTLFGVYALLRESAGVTWLWPGEGGEVVPRRGRLQVTPREGVESPVLRFRMLGRARTYRWSVLGEAPPPRMRPLGFSPEARVSYGEALELFLKRHGVGGEARRPSPGHRFQDWRERFGGSRSHWFLHPGEQGWAAGMCLPAPGLVEALVAEGPDWRGVLDVSEVDGPVAGTGPGCQEWDGGHVAPLHPPEVAAYYGPPWLSQRYATFWARVAARTPPSVTVSTFLYMNYLPAPPDPPALGSRVYGEFVPFAGGDADFFPMSHATLGWLLEQWEGWAATGMRLGYRPNHLHDGYSLPWIAPRQFAQLFPVLVERGMEGAYFDSLTGQWGTQGPWLYLQLRLLQEPFQDAEGVLEEFYSAFGPAARQVEAYFYFWERFTEGSRERVAEVDFGGNRWDRFQVAAHQVIPRDVLLQGGAFLTLAEAAVEAEAGAAARTAAAGTVGRAAGTTVPMGDAPVLHEILQARSRLFFLRLGWIHALLTVELSREMAVAGGDPGLAMACLKRFRADTEALFVADFDTLADKETRHWSFTSGREGPTFPSVPPSPHHWWGGSHSTDRSWLQPCLELLH
ncbi:MAG: hypothetical protein WEA09_12645 [Gemmatimonadota bacterium]